MFDSCPRKPGKFSCTPNVFALGQCRQLRARRDNEDESKEFWTRCAIVISKDQNLTKAHVRFLESRLIYMGHGAGRAALCNGTAPPAPPLPESDIADMEFFLGQLEIVFPLLGFGFLQSRPQVGPVPSDESPVFTLTVAGAQARAREVNGEFIVLKGSTARKEGIRSWTSYKGQRDQLVNDGKLVASEQDGLLVFAEDVSFASPSAGAAVVNAGNINGRTAWKVEATGATYQAWHDAKLADVGIESQDEDKG